MNEKDKNKGFIILNRKLLEWQHFTEQNYLTVFIALLLTANHSPRYWKGHYIKRGETVISIASLSMLCGLSVVTINKILKGLVKSGEIVRIRNKNFNSKTIIVNYDKYQAVTSVKNFGYKENDRRTLIEQQLYNKNNTNTSLYNNNIDPQKFLTEMLNSGILVEQFCKNERISIKQFKKLSKEVIDNWKLTKKTHLNESDMRQHLLNSIRAIIRARNIIIDDIDSRLNPFIDDCKNLIADGYPAEEVRKFYKFWTQPCNDNSGRMLFENVKAFDATTKFLDYFNKRK